MELTQEIVKENWKKGYYTIVGYLYFLTLTSDCPEWPLSTPNIKERCEELGISRRAFLSARKKLLEQGEIIQSKPGVYVLAF